MSEEAMRADEWVTLEELRPGAIFETESGSLVVKSEYRYDSKNPQPLCILLGSGEFAHFPQKQLTKVREILVWITEQPNEKIL